MGAAALAHDAAAGQSHLRIENCVWQVSILTPYDTGTRHNRARGVRSYGDATGSPHGKRPAARATVGRDGVTVSPHSGILTHSVSFYQATLTSCCRPHDMDISSSIWAKNIFSFT